MSHQSKRPDRYVLRVNWSDENKIKLLESMIKKGYNVESIATRMYTTESAIRSAIEKHTPGIRRLRSTAKRTRF